jgi:hypothetical protein
MADMNRPTADVDLHSYGNGSISHKELLELFDEACRLDLNDGITFRVTKTSILEHEHYEDHGLRAYIESHIGKTRANIHLDVGIGGEPPVGLRPLEIKPLFKNDEGVTVMAQPWVYSISEKLHAMVDQGMNNTRMKDYRDLWVLMHKGFDKQAMHDAVVHTFAIRAKDMPDYVPEGLLPCFADAKQQAWTDYLERNDIAGLPADLMTVVGDLQDYYADVVMYRSPVSDIDMEDLLESLFDDEPASAYAPRISR